MIRSSMYVVQELRGFFHPNLMYFGCEKNIMLSVSTIRRENKYIFYEIWV